jgi:hypothetical protein
VATLKRHAPGHPVTFSNPTTKTPVIGHIQDEVWVTEPERFERTAPKNGGWRQAAFLAQLIDWEDGHESVRFTYYLRPEGGGPSSWYFGGQYSPSMSLREFRLLVSKIAKTGW